MRTMEGSHFFLNMLKKKKIAVICGGNSSEHDVSIKSGHHVAKHLNNRKYDVTIINISKDGVWKMEDGTDINVFPYNNQKSDLDKFDKVFIALHGENGEDGRVQAMLDMIGVSYTGSGVLASAWGIDKWQTHRILEKYDIAMPQYIVVQRKDDINIDDIDRKVQFVCGYPCFVKPNKSGSSLGMSIVHSKDDLREGIEKALSENDVILIMEYIKGREISCATIGNAHHEIWNLPPVEVITENEYFDYEAKYMSKKTQEICPAELREVQEQEVKDVAQKVHRILSCQGVTRSDFILGGDNVLYFLEINTSPGMTEESIVPKAVRATGRDFGDFLDEILNI